MTQHNNDNRKSYMVLNDNANLRTEDIYTANNEHMLLDRFLKERGYESLSISMQEAGYKDYLNNNEQVYRELK